MELVTRYGKVGMAVVIHGKEIAEYPHGDGKTYFWVRFSTEYSIAVWNFTDRRIETVVTVDGLNIIQGDVGDYRMQRGYIIPAHSKPKPIPGFRLDGDNAARFVFKAPGESYAALTNKSTDIGVIGAAFFSERSFPVLQSLSLLDSHDPTQFGSTVTRLASAGTGFGRRVYFHTKETQFIREDPMNPLGILALHYHTRERLAEMGIDAFKPPEVQVATGPNPFPANRDGCKPPQGWTER